MARLAFCLMANSLHGLRHHYKAIYVIKSSLVDFTNINLVSVYI